MKDFFKANWLAIAICLVYTLIAAGVAVYFVKSSAQESKAALLKVTEELKIANDSLEKSNTELTTTKEDLDKEKALTGDQKKMMAESNDELEKLRGSLKAATVIAAKTAKPNTRSGSALPVCQESKANRDKLTALKKLQADINRRDGELREKQKKLDETMNKLADEKRKLIMQNSEYRWPHNTAPMSK
jgi:uncharacterized membrane protein YraQ (UPF0718 family)